MSQTFDLVGTPLESGVTRLEASAGTGKTYALAGLFLRLLIEARIPASEILVVTFTEAATAELRDRIRQGLRAALLVLEGGPTTDALLLALAERAQPRLAAAVQSLRNALEIFDLVSIHTIHGFCQRTLQDSAFESGILFDVELVTDPEPLLHEIAADYFRRLIHRGDPLLASVAISQDLTPLVLSQMLKRCQTYPQLRLVPSAPSRPLAEVEALLIETFGRLREVWTGTEAEQLELRNYFTGGKKWANGDHARAEVLAIHAATLAAGLSEVGLSTEFWSSVELFALSAVRTDLGKGKQMPQPVPPLFGLCEELQALAADFTFGHRLAFLRSSRQALEARKQRDKQQSFDDLITRLAGALDRPEGESLARTVRRKFRAALIDEFQDTDPLQWKIFHTLFGQSKDHWLYLIGDPKQAIYGFRGADVHAYLQAKPVGEKEYSLANNYRSEAPLVRAVNALVTHAGAKTAFVESGIEFAPAQAAGQADLAPFLRDGQRPAPFQVWNWEPDGKAVTGGEAEAQLPVSVAAEISRLLSGSDTLGGWRLQPRDIAVLVESHRQAGRIQSALHDLRIPSVEQAMHSVFDSDEARELQWILAAILAPGNERRVKAALTTDMLGLDANSLQTLTAHETDWQARLQRLAGYRECWEADGFFFMFSRMAHEERVIEHLLRFSDGERRITNFLHLGELLQTASQSEHLSPLRLAQWLEGRRLSEDTGSDDYQLRLESDEDAVQIVTIHRSKGLQYPVVFCPFISKDAKLRPIKVGGRSVLEMVLYHDVAANALTWDLSPEPAPEHRQQAAKELLAENVRLLYVALTRACHRCYLVSARYSSKSSTALAWLMQPQKETVTDFSAALKTAKPAPGEWRRQWEAIAAASEIPTPPAIAITDLPLEKGNVWKPERPALPLPNYRSCPRPIPPSWSLSSYTQLSSRLPAGHADAADQPDHDEVALEPGPQAEELAPSVVPTGIFALPPGARTGDCLHQILEQFDFATGVETATIGWVKSQLEAFGLFDDAHARSVCEMLARLCSTPLDPGRPDFTLSHIPKEHRLAELEFHFPAEHLNADALLAAIRQAPLAAARAAHEPERGHPVRFGEAAIAGGEIPVGEPSAQSGRGRPRSTPPVHPVAGFLKGFMDLVFVFEDRYYILDWKSNRLGNCVEDYNQEAMVREIRRSFYDLQYHLYTVALDRYLRVRLPGYDYKKHFGGVRYVFLRGVQPEDPTLGVFSDRPSRETLARLTAVLGQFGVKDE